MVAAAPGCARGLGWGTLPDKQNPVSSKRAREGKSEMLRATDRRNTLWPKFQAPLLSDWCLKFESPQMWHGLTFGLWVVATGEMIRETVQTEMCCNVEKAFLTQPH